MAKSIRSKWKRKCRAIKRERYGKKELERLKKTLGIDDSETGCKEVKINDINLDEVSEIANVTTFEEIKERQAEEEANEEQMEVDKRVFNTRTMRDQHGAYPVWLHPRKIKKGNKNKRKQKKGKKQGKRK